jgi:hypothetical protein
MKTTREINFKAHYQVAGYRGIAFYLRGYAVTREPLMCFAEDEDGNEIEIASGDFEDVEDREHVVAVMVGDDRKHIVSVDDIEAIPEISFCRDCGQIGCHCNNYE